MRSSSKKSDHRNTFQSDMLLSAPFCAMPPVSVVTCPYPVAGQTAAKVLEGSHQQHGFLSITYTQAVTKNVRHKLTTRPERPTTASQQVNPDLLADASPQYLREILLTAQPFDVVLSCPLLASVARVFQVGQASIPADRPLPPRPVVVRHLHLHDLHPQATVPRRYRERGKSAGQPMRSHTLTSRCLPLIYINTSVIRIFCPGTQDKHAASGPSVCLPHAVENTRCRSMRSQGGLDPSRMTTRVMAEQTCDPLIPPRLMTNSGHVVMCVCCDVTENQSGILPSQ